MNPTQWVEQFERRLLLSFSAWGAIGPAIAKVPASAGHLASVAVVNFGSTVYTGPLDVTNTLSRIRADDGPDRTDDGSVFSNNGELPTGHGTWYEFTVEVAGGTDRSFANVASPGPMRILLAADGDTYFTGDHYSTFHQVYDPSAARAPVIGSFGVSPASVAAGNAVTLTAAGVTEAGGTIAGVTFYRESNGTAGLQTGQAGPDAVVGAGARNGTTWTIAAPTAGMAAGAYTYYAVATDTAGAAGVASSAALTVTAPVPAAAVLGWDVGGLTGGGPQGLAATAVGTGATNRLGLTRGAGVAAAAAPPAGAWGAAGWASTAAGGAAAGQSVTFGLTVSAGYTLSLASIDLDYRRSGAGPAGGSWQYRLNGGAWATIADVPGEFPASTSAGGSIAELGLGGVAGLKGLPAGAAVDFRLTPYGATSAGGTWYVYDLAGYDMVLNGTAARVPDPAPPVVVQSTQLAGGAAQRSFVRTASVTFDRAVTLAAGAFTLAGPAVAGLSWANPSADGRTWVVTFAGTGPNGGLPDGTYDLAVAATGVRAAADGGSPASDFHYAFYVLAGDGNGDGVVDLADFALLQNHFGQPGTPDQGDYNGDGVVDLADFALLQNNFNKTAVAPPAALASAALAASTSTPPSSTGRLHRAPRQAVSEGKAAKPDAARRPSCRTPAGNA